MSLPRGNIYKIVNSGSRKPITHIESSGPLYNGKPTRVTRRTYVFVSYYPEEAWESFCKLANSTYHYQGVQLLFDNTVIAEAYRNPKPRHDYDIYRIKLSPKAPKDLKDYVLEEVIDGRRFVAEY